jgi:hypothetical protein
MSQGGQAEGAGWVLGQTGREAQDLPSGREKWSRCSMDRHLLHSLPKTISHSAKDRMLKETDNSVTANCKMVVRAQTLLYPHNQFKQNSENLEN